MSFGFSVRDFISALEVVGIMIDALRTSGRAARQYQGLFKELQSLKFALLAIAEYEPHLWMSGSQSRLKNGVMKIRWAFCEADDVTKFQSDLMAHTAAIQTLIGVLQILTLEIQRRKLGEQHQTIKSFAGLLQQGYFAQIKGIVNSGEQDEQRFARTNQILSKDIRVCQSVLEYQDLVTRIPGQIEHQQPVYLLDAMGRRLSIHLEFIKSAQDFVGFLKSHFNYIGNACQKIDRGQFILENWNTDQILDKDTDWSTSLSPVCPQDSLSKPGIHVGMEIREALNGGVQ
ncbi:hypothetical protein V8E51_000730 [Hyaloscypha variabilis]